MDKLILIALLLMPPSLSDLKIEQAKLKHQLTMGDKITHAIQTVDKKLSYKDRLNQAMCHAKARNMLREMLPGCMVKMTMDGGNKWLVVIYWGDIWKYYIGYWKELIFLSDSHDIMEARHLLYQKITMETLACTNEVMYSL